MSNLPVYVGLDYHQSGVQVCVLDRQGRALVNKMCANSWQAVVEAVKPHGMVARAAIESCSGAADFAEELISHAEWNVDLAHPGYVSRMRLNPDKTDYSDARMLADLERVGYLPKVWLAPKAVRELRLMVRYRQQQVAERRNVKLRIGAILREQRLKYTKHGRWSLPWHWWLRNEAALSEQGRWVVDQHLTELKYRSARIADTEKRLAKVCRDDPLIRRLLGIAGIGKVTAWTFRAEIGRFDRFHNGKQLARFCGLTPRNASSGLRQADAGLIHAANKDLRTVAMEAAHRLIRTNARWKEMAARMRADGKAPNVTVAAVANRWVRWLFNEVRRPCAA